MVSRTQNDATESAMSALARAVEAGQRMIVDRIDLVALELKETAGSAARMAVMAGIGATAALLGWIGLMGAAVALLSRFLEVWGSLAIVGALHLLAGGAMLLLSRGQPHRPRLVVQPDEVRSGTGELQTA